MGAFLALAALVAIPGVVIVGILKGWLAFSDRVDGMIADRKKKPRKERQEEPPKERRPSLVAAYMRAQKDRVCPKIELVD